MIDPSKLIVDYKFGQKDQSRKLNYRYFITQINSDRYQFYQNFNKSLYICPVFQYVNSVFFVLDYRLDRLPKSNDELRMLFNICISNKLYPIYDGVTLRVVSAFMLYYNGTANNVDYYYNYYRMLHEPKFRSFGYRIVEDKEIFQKYYPRMGVNEVTNRPIIPILKEIQFDQFQDLVNKDNIRDLQINLYFDYESYIKKYLVPQTIINVKQK